MYYYETRLGTFYIKSDPKNLGRCCLYFDEQDLGSYDSPMQAADDVYGRHTFSGKMDLLRARELPSELGDWSLKI